jgi:hypothetical protein
MFLATRRYTECVSNKRVTVQGAFMRISLLQSAVSPFYEHFCLLHTNLHAGLHEIVYISGLCVLHIQ